MQTNLFNDTSTNKAAGNNAAVTPAADQASKTSDMFTKLLVAQIKNQDPLAPSDPSQFVNQLSQLSQTEALQNLAKLTTANASVMQSMQVMALGAQVGSNVMVVTDRVQLAGNKIEGNIALTTASTKTTVLLTGADGASHEVQLGARAPGNVSFTLDPAKLGLPAGNYKIAVKTSTPEIPEVEIVGKLDSVRLSGNGGMVLKVANVGEVDPGAITAFNGKSATLASAN
ncbi:flagellar hook capping FlgD N-terminal domain-containing protein [Janthinobacterium fluminis]|uniref:Basal-body rod modification protein FlgD n=1 Tax=Janthinobacterium fluminis TaxID=2987524 RepID=A0ABT5JUS9_9BURK|nr:flagellar hook capping FlgD N-terminal domain-containing protein [Janthinobacterium fluminis]MDC8756482.1 flagellar hook capping FlgD N-terminal domain-containing protein [Janthinobacterium fluminis]